MGRADAKKRARECRSLQKGLGRGSWPEQASPADVGMDPDRLALLRRAVEADTEKGVYDGAVFVVGRHGKVVAHEAVGLANLGTGRPAKRDDVFCVMSITKQMTAVRVLMDVEKGKFGLTTRVCDLIPEFGIKGKQNITVWHLLTHTSGVNGQIPFTLPLDRLCDIETVTRCLCNECLAALPGTLVLYNLLTSFSLLAELVQRLDERKRPFRRILAEDLFEPLGMSDTALGLPERLKARLVPVVVRDTTPGLFDPFLIESLNVILTEEAELPGGGAVSTALDVFRFAEMLRQGGSLGGVRFLSPETVRMATTNQTGNLPNLLMDHMREMHGWPIFPAYLGLSFFLRGAGHFPTPHGLAASSGTFGGMGAGSTLFWVDPEKDLTFVFLSAGLLEDGKSILRHQRLSDLVIASVVD